ncbi:2-haloacid dehalogenase [Desulfitobacterium sp. LBE]|uniref:YjjG family noncanonical pyrimidine nucleotidase n=1 Tax=Desulfitobacterium sp. LBE TaxID=884086 RepID=UPI00119BE49B|nr:YjjG family noncanonical pyrimidine nucleotidase [Desulfitobacterium sp. LBE]TWH56665.1 2-haloacid dehalogenase [Desulfitobacterium sp. LBE]
MYKALFFDVDDTLLNFEQCSREALGKTFRHFSMDYDDTVYELFRSIDQRLWLQQKQGELTVQDVINLRFQELFKQLQLGCSHIPLQTMFQERLAEEFFTEPHAAESLGYLSARYQLFVTSNGILKTQLKRLELAGLLPYFTDVFVSDHIGHEKPSVRFFEECLQRSRLKPSEVLLIGDSLEADMVGAQNSKMDSCWYNPKHRNTDSDVEIDYIISDLLQLKDILQVI